MDFDNWEVPDEIRQRFLNNQSDDKDFIVLSKNWATVQLFLSVATQWRLGPAGGITGLDYSAVDTAIKYSGVEVDANTFQGLQIMERFACDELNKRLADER